MNSSALTPMTLNQTLGLRVREARKRLGMSQQELSALLEFEHVQTISQIENGERQVKAWELARISSVLHTSINELLKEDAFAEPVVLWREQPRTTTRRSKQNSCTCRTTTILLKSCPGFGRSPGYDPPRYPAKSLDTVRQLNSQWKLVRR